MLYYLYKLENSLKFDKCGATTQWDKRCRDNRASHGSQCIITLLETMEGPNEPEFWKIVGDREWELADLYGYPRGNHYKFAREKRPVWNDEIRHTFSKEECIAGGTTSGRNNVESGHIQALGKIWGPINGTIQGQKNAKSGQVSTAGKKGGPASAASPKSVHKQKRQCTYCDKVSTPGAIAIHMKACKHKKRESYRFPLI